MASVAMRNLSTAVVKSSLWQRAKEIPVQYPMGFGVVLSGFKTSFSDLLVQKVVERREEIDWKRNAAFASFGFVYLGGVQYVLYVPIFSRLFPSAARFAAKPFREKLKDTKGMFHLSAQVFLDQCVHHPLMYFPAFYCTKELVMSDKPDFGKVLSEYVDHMEEDLKALWKIWVPATLVNFAFMPMHLRIPCVAATSLVWTCILSAMRGGDVVHSDDMVGGAVTGASYLLLKEGLDENFNMSPVEMDEHLAHYNISAVGKNRQGLVAMLSKHIEEHGGNVTHSKMVRLGQEFIIQMHVACQPERSRQLYKSFGSKDLRRELDIQVTKLNREEYNEGSKMAKAVIGMKIHCVGADKPGMIARLAQKAAEKGMSIEELSTGIRMGLDGKREFIIDGMISSPNLADRDNLEAIIADIKTLEQDLELSHFDIRVHMA